MQLPSFIRLENTIEKALYYRESPQMKYYSFEGVQLLPNNPLPYIQRTYAAEGIELEDFTVYVCDLCNGTRLAEMPSPQFSVVNTFQDPQTGLPQIDWQLLNVAYDAGYGMIYLEIEYGVNGKMYSSPFMLTAEKSQFTSRWDYKNREIDTMLSTQLQVYFRQPMSEMVTANYNPVSSGYAYTATSKLNPYEKWNSNVVDIYIIEEIKRVFQCRYRYVDLRFTSLQEAIETPELEADENFTEQEILLIRDKGLVYDPLYVPPTPPPPPPLEPEITITLIEILNKSQIRFTFTYEDFSPAYLTYQWSEDNITWNSQTNGIVSPHILTVSQYNLTEVYELYYRIVYNNGEVVSNVVHLEPEIVITSVTGSGSTRQVSYTYSDFTIINNTNITFELSNDGGSTWFPAGFSTADNNNPKTITLPSASPQWSKVRAKYPSLGIVSNEFDF